MSVTRRALLGTGGALFAGFATWRLAEAAVAAGPPPTATSCTPSTVTTYGPAMLSAATRGAAVLGNRVFVTTRFSLPDGRMRLAEFDADSHELLSLHDLDLGPTTGGREIISDGTHLYLGLAGGSSIWRYDPVTGTATPFASTGNTAIWIYGFAIDETHLYTSTYPDCMIRRYRLSDGAVETYGRVSDSNYATAVAVDADHVYGAAASPGGLLRWPKEGGAPLDLTAQLSESPVGVLDMIVHDGTIHVSSGRNVITMNTDGSGRVVRTIADEDRYVDFFTVGADGHVYCVAKLTTNVYRVTTTGLDNVGRPFDDVENVGFDALPDGRLVGVSGIGHLWTLTPGGESQVWNAADTDYGYPEEIQSMMRHSTGRVWVGGHYAMTVHDVTTRTNQRFDIKGEVKAMAEGTDGTVYAGLYPSTEIVAVDPASLAIRSLGSLLNGQMRPKRIHVDEEHGQLVIASGPTTRSYQGAVTFIDLATGKMEVRKDYLPDQSAMDVVLHRGVAYVVGDTYGEGNPGPLQPAAQVAAIDLATRRLLWRRVLHPDWKSIESIAAKGNLLYLMGRRPLGWFAWDLRTGAIAMQGELGGYGQVNAVAGRVFTWVHWARDIRELPTQVGDPVRVLQKGPLPDGWFNNPMFSFEPGGRATWGMYGTDLARFTLPQRTGPVADATLPPVGPANGDFEMPAAGGTVPGWSVRFGSMANFSLGTAPQARGTSLRVVDDSTLVATGLVSDPSPVAAGTTYRLSAQLWREVGTPSLYLYFFDSTGKQLDSLAQTFPTTVGTWSEASMTATAPEGATSATILVYSAKAGTSAYWIDDIVLVPHPDGDC